MNSTTGTGDSILSVVSSAEISRNYLLDHEGFQHKNERTHKPPVKVSEDPEPEPELVLVAAGVEDEVLVEVFFDLVEEAWVVSAAAVVSELCGLLPPPPPNRRLRIRDSRAQNRDQPLGGRDSFPAPLKARGKRTSQAPQRSFPMSMSTV